MNINLFLLMRPLLISSIDKNVNELKKVNINQYLNQKNLEIIHLLWQ